jgi:hypothetical protein
MIVWMKKQVYGTVHHSALTKLRENNAMLDNLKTTCILLILKVSIKGKAVWKRICMWFTVFMPCEQ